MKKAKPSAGKTKRPQKMTKEELIATLMKKKECNAKALSVVEGLLEGRVNEQWLLSSLQFITQSHYQDAIEERAILKICGYPICSNPLLNIPKQQYRISTQNNKVYDISERKHFCSNSCYRASSFLKDQILTSPLWLRDIETAPDFKLFDGGNTRSGVGDEIDVGPTRITTEEASLTSLPPENIDSEVNVKNQDCEVAAETNPEARNEDLSDNDPLPSTTNKPQISETNNSENTPLGNAIQKDLSVSISLPVPPTIPRVVDQLNNLHKIDTIEEQLKTLKIEDTIAGSAVHDETDVPDDKQVSRTQATTTEPVDQEQVRLINKIDITKKDAPTDDAKTKARKPKRTKAHAKVPVVALPQASEFVEQRLIEWFTIDSVCFLYGEQRTREILGEQATEFDQNFKPLDSATWDPEKHERFVKICKRLNLLDLEDKNFDEKALSDERNISKKPVPDFSKLKEEAEKMDLRVRAFYKGQLEMEPRGVTFAEDVKEGANEEEGTLPVLPLVHQHEQRAVRRRLVLDALNRVLPDLLRTLGLNASHVNSVLRGLIGTFALTAVNITLNPRQWTLVAIAVIKLLAVREVRLNMALASEASQKYFTLIQMSYNLGPTFLDQLIDRLVSSALFPAR